MKNITNITRKDLSKEIQKKYRELNELFWAKWINENKFTDKFLEIYEEVQNKVFVLLSSSEKLNQEKVEETVEKLFQNTFNKAILSIIDINKSNALLLNYSIFKSKWTIERWKNWKSNFDFKEWFKYEEFLKLYNELFFWKKDVDLKIYMENVDSSKVRNSPYFIINIYWNNIWKTILLSNKIWEATFIYNTIIEPKSFEFTTKWQEINWERPIRIVYDENYTKELKELILQKEFYEYKDSEITDEDVNKREQDYYNKIYIKTILTSITDAKWNKVDIDLNTIWVVDFRNLYFWKNTKYGKISGQRLLKNNWWTNSAILKKVLEIYWINRKDLADTKLDYNNQEHIKELLNNVTDSKLNKVEVDYNKISLIEFSKLNLWHWTEFWKIKWITLLINVWWENNITLRNILSMNWVERKDLPSETIDYNNESHIKTILSSITDKYWDKLEVDLKTIWLENFKKLYFGYNTRFWKINWYWVLRASWWEATKVLKKVLEKWWISRWDLASDDIEYNNPEHIREVLAYPSDKSGNKIQIDLNTIRMKQFDNLYFWYGTRFWLVTWQSLLIKNWNVNNPTVKKVLELIGIQRPDLS